MLRLLYHQTKTGRIYRSFTTTFNDHEKLSESKNYVEDAFTKEFEKNRIQLTDIQKIILGAGSSIAALIDPRRHDMIACLGETTGESALQNMLDQMKNNTEGQEIIANKPRINTKTIDLEELGKLREDQFGYQYYKFLKDNVSGILYNLLYLC